MLLLAACMMMAVMMMTVLTMLMLVTVVSFSMMDICWSLCVHVGWLSGITWTGWSRHCTLPFYKFFNSKTKLAIVHRIVSCMSYSVKV